MPATRGGIHKVRVTDLDYKNDIKRTIPVITRGKAGFMCCFGPGGHIFGYDDKGKDMWYCKPWGKWWSMVLENTADILAQIETTFTHGVFNDGTRKPTPSHTLTVHNEFSPGHTRRYSNIKRLRRVTHLLVRLQRWFLRLLSIWRSKRLAVAMSLHARLGCDSGLGRLGEDLLPLVLILATRTTAETSYKQALAGTQNVRSKVFRDGEAAHGLD